MVNNREDSCRQSNIGNKVLRGEGRFVYFCVGPQFAKYGMSSLEVTILAKRIAASKPALLGLFYESTSRFCEAKGGQWLIPEDDQWHENIWKLTDASFVGQWGWNFQLNAAASPNDF